MSALAYGGGADGPQFTETRTYNNLMQLTQLTNAGVNMQYIYPTGQNNGRVSQTIDGVLNEQVNYTYDIWSRLTAAARSLALEPPPSGAAWQPQHAPRLACKNKAYYVLENSNAYFGEDGSRATISARWFALSSRFSGCLSTFFGYWTARTSGLWLGSYRLYSV